jgi:flavin reductase (DIM6/NTAB) family NADH-FMN oxidoreductase RutF
MRYIRYFRNRRIWTLLRSMFYEPQTGELPAPLTHNPFLALVAPRPIAWITSLGLDGSINLAPYSHYNTVSVDPPMVMFAPSDKESAAGSPKDTLRNVTEVPEFVVNVATWGMREAVNLSSAVLDYGDSELLRCGLRTEPSTNVRPPRLAGVPAALECRVFDTLRLPMGKRGRASTVVVGEVVGIYIEDSMIADGRVQPLKLAQLSRLGYFDYSSIKEVFEMRRPKSE